jgi:hypothetical protein
MPTCQASIMLTTGMRLARYLLVMPRFYFHVFNGEKAADERGIDLPDWEAAVDHATKAARAKMAEDIKDNGRIALYHRIEVADCDGPVATVRFEDAVDIES